MPTVSLLLEMSPWNMRPFLLVADSAPKGRGEFPGGDDTTSAGAKGATSRAGGFLECGADAAFFSPLAILKGKRKRRKSAALQISRLAALVDALAQVVRRLVVEGQQLRPGLRPAELPLRLDVGPALLHAGQQRPGRLQVEHP